MYVCEYILLSGSKKAMLQILIDTTARPGPYKNLCCRNS